MSKNSVKLPLINDQFLSSNSSSSSSSSSSHDQAFAGGMSIEISGTLAALLGTMPKRPTSSRESGSGPETKDSSSTNQASRARSKIEKAKRMAKAYQNDKDDEDNLLSEDDREELKEKVAMMSQQIAVLQMILLLSPGQRGEMFAGYPMVSKKEKLDDTEMDVEISSRPLSAINGEFIASGMAAESRRRAEIAAVETNRLQDGRLQRYHKKLVDNRKLQAELKRYRNGNMPGKFLCKYCLDFKNKECMAKKCVGLRNGKAHPPEDPTDALFFSKNPVPRGYIESVEQEKMDLAAKVGKDAGLAAASLLSMQNSAKTNAKAGTSQSARLLQMPPPRKALILTDIGLVPRELVEQNSALQPFSGHNLIAALRLPLDRDERRQTVSLLASNASGDAIVSITLRRQQEGKKRLRSSSSNLRAYRNEDWNVRMDEMRLLRNPPLNVQYRLADYWLCGTIMEAIILLLRHRMAALDRAIRLASNENSSTPISSSLESIYIGTHILGYFIAGGNKNDMQRIAKRWHVNPFGRRLILTPLNLGNVHWGLICCDMKEQIIYGFNPMEDGSLRKVYNRYLDYFEVEAAEGKGVEHFNRSEWKYVQGICPQQIGSFDCGVMVLMMVLFICHGLPMTFSHSDCCHFRILFAHAIRCNELIMGGDAVGGLPRVTDADRERCDDAYAKGEVDYDDASNSISSSSSSNSDSSSSSFSNSDSSSSSSSNSDCSSSSSNSDSSSSSSSNSSSSSSSSNSSSSSSSSNSDSSFSSFSSSSSSSSSKSSTVKQLTSIAVLKVPFIRIKKYKKLLEFQKIQKIEKDLDAILYICMMYENLCPPCCINKKESFCSYLLVCISPDNVLLIC